MDFSLQSYLFMGSVPIIVGIVQVFKLWVKDTRIYPIIAIVLGIGFNLGIGAYTSSGYLESAVMGIIAGLSAAGMYSTVTAGK